MNDEGSPAMSQSDALAYATPTMIETRQHQAAQTALDPSMTGSNFFQHAKMPNHFGHAFDFKVLQRVSFPSSFGRRSAGDNPNLRRNNGVMEKGIVVPTPIQPGTTLITPPYVHRGAPNHRSPPQTRALSQQAGNIRQHVSANPYALVPVDISARSGQPSKKRQRIASEATKAVGAAKVAKAKVTGGRVVKTKANIATIAVKAVAGRRPQLKASPTRIPSIVQASSTTYTDTYRVPTNLGLVTRHGPVPRPAERSSSRNAAATRANDPTQTYGETVKDFPAFDATPPRNVDIGMLEICTFFPNWLSTLR